MFWALLLCLIGSPVFSASAQETFAQPDYSKFPVESGPITLEVWSWVAGLDKAAKVFEQAYPNIKVHVNNLGGGAAQYQKLQTSIKSGSGGPDVAQIEYMFLPSFIATEGLADLSKLGANDLKSFFVPWTWGQVSPDGKAVYGIPQDTGPMALLYNKKIFDQYGLAVPTTWDEFAQQAEKLSQASSGKVKMANFFPTHAPWFISLAWASGAELFKPQGDGYRLSTTLLARRCLPTGMIWLRKSMSQSYRALPQNFTMPSARARLRVRSRRLGDPGFLLLH